MGIIREHDPVMLVTAVFSHYEEAFSWAEAKLTSLWGDILLKSEPFSFKETSFYEDSMGEELSLRLISFATLIFPESLAEIKLKTNELEAHYKQESSHPESRPLNIDPGYLAPGKFVLGTTKDASHRIYLSDGIFAEVTLHYAHGAWQHHTWTYPNYLREDYKQFLTQSKEILLEKLRCAHE